MPILLAPATRLWTIIDWTLLSEEVHHFPRMPRAGIDTSNMTWYGTQMQCIHSDSWIAENVEGGALEMYNSSWERMRVGSGK